MASPVPVTRDWNHGLGHFGRDRNPKFLPSKIAGSIWRSLTLAGWHISGMRPDFPDE